MKVRSNWYEKQQHICLILKENNGEKEREIYKNLSNTHYYHGYLDYCKS
jgi:hypothetical protein